MRFILGYIVLFFIKPKIKICSIKEEAGFFLLFWAVEYYLIPFITMLSAVIILNEKITVMGISGAVMIVAGVFISSFNRKQNVKTQENF